MKSRTTCIVTHPLFGNYGASLQYIALKVSIERLQIFVLRLRYFSKTRFTLFAVLIYILRIMKYRVKRINIVNSVSSFFKDTYVNIPSYKAIRSMPSIDHYVVGSDQIWRASHVRQFMPIPDYFLKFATVTQRNHSISYAASFGTNTWEGTPEETEVCKQLLRDFKAVSVREHSGVKICKEVFGVDAVQMPDPTLLLYTSDYEKIIASEETWLPERKYVAAYVLDETAGKAQMLLDSAGRLGLLLQHLMPHTGAKKRRDRFPIRVPQWLRLIRDCDYFITDSFHGCVFAIIYNIPFACLGNAGRGNARFDTLLGTFGLEERLVTNASPDEICRILNTPIDWERVNAIHDEERERGISFLKDNLTE